MNDEGVFAETTIEETFEREFGVYDLKKLLALLSMQKSPNLAVGDAVLTIKGDKSAISVRHTNTKLIKSPPSDKRIVADYFLSFPMTVANIKSIFDTSSILGTRHVVFQGKDGRLTVEACDVEGKVVDAGSLNIGETPHTFKAVWRLSRENPENQHPRPSFNITGFHSQATILALEDNMTCAENLEVSKIHLMLATVIGNDKK